MDQYSEKIHRRVCFYPPISRKILDIPMHARKVEIERLSPDDVFRSQFLTEECASRSSIEVKRGFLTCFSRFDGLSAWEFFPRREC